MGKGESTRVSILDDAVQMASRVGFGALSIGRLADHAEMSKSGLFAHFKSKEQLQLQTLERARRRFIDAVVRPALAAPRGGNRLRALFDGWNAWDEGMLEGGCIFVAAAFELDAQPGPLRDALVQSERDWLELIATVAGTAVAAGELDADLDTDQFAFEVHGIMLSRHYAGRLMLDERAQERAQAAFERLLTATRPSC